MPATEAEKKAIAKYKAKTVRRFSFEVNRRTEADILNHLESKPSINGYIKELIRKDMEQTPT